MGACSGAKPIKTTRTKVVPIGDSGGSYRSESQLNEPRRYCTVVDNTHQSTHKMHPRILIPLLVAAEWGLVSGEQNFGPLTTVFTPPATCNLTTAFPASASYNPTGAGIGIAEVYGMTDNPATACYPSDFGISGASTDYFSPGRCPFGYTTGSHSTTGDETRALCCPTGFTEGTYYTPCERKWYGILTAQALLTRTGTGLEFYLVSSTSEFASSDRMLYATGIPIRWRRDELATTKSSSSPSPTPSGAPSTSSSTASPTASSAPVPQSDGLSVGASVGSILGAIFGAAAVAATVFFGWRAMRNRSGP